MTNDEEESGGAARGSLRKYLVELKARVDSPGDVERRLRARGATFQATLHQRDVYFTGVRGRLKLRLQRPGRDQLVWYDRPNTTGTKESKIVLSALPSDHGLEAVLTSALEVRVTVSKVRRVFEWKGTRVHLDEVEGLGSFLEFERRAEPGSTTSAHQDLTSMLGELGVPTDALESGSYSDLLSRRP
jgi:adenylate cyclase, class 2